jgi:transposase InsO family protein
MPDPYEIATWRYELIAPLIDPSLSRARRRAALRERLAKPGAGSDGEQPKRVGRSTLFRWLSAFRARGYLGLVPKARSDRGKLRRSGTAAWVSYAIGLLYEQPDRSLTQLTIYLKAEFAAYSLGTTTLRRHLRAHPAYSGIQTLRSGKKSRLRDRYEADHPHEGWQLDGKGPFLVRFADGTRVEVYVLTVLDDHSRYALAAVAATAEDRKAAIRVFEKAVAKWGLADRFQFDRGAAFDSYGFRQGLAWLGVHRNRVIPRSPEWQGKIEAYHRCLDRWFVRELRTQQVVDLVHLQQLLEAMLALVYNRHHHREIGTTPEKKLANRISERRVSPSDLERCFLLGIIAKSDPKTGEVRLPNGSFRIPSKDYAGQRSRFLYHPVHEGRAVLVTRDGREIELQSFSRKPLSTLTPHVERRGTGQLQKLVDLWEGKERPNAQPGFGLPEVFAALSRLLGRDVPGSEREAHAVLAFYRKYGPLAREGFEAACARTRKSLGTGRPLSAWLDDLERQITSNTKPSSSPSEEP